MAYNYYHGVLWQAREFMRSQGQKLMPTQVEDAIVNMAVRFASRFGVGATQEAVTVIEEGVHYCMGHRVIYVSAALAEQLMVTDFYLQLEGLNLPAEIFEVCIDSDFEIVEGKQAPGVLSIITPGKATIDAIMYFLRKIQAHFGPAEIERPNWLSDSITLRYKDIYTSGLCHAVIPVTGEYAGRTIDEAIDSLGDKRMTLAGSVPMDPQDVELQKRLARIVMGAVCYLNTSEPDARDFKDGQRPRFAVPAKATLIGKTVQREEFYRLRKAHWRHLTHPRFQRDEAGHVKVTWVRPASVHYGARTKEVKPDETKLGE